MPERHFKDGRRKLLFFHYFVAIYISYHLQTFMFSKAMTKKELQRAPYQPQSRK